MFSAVHVGAKGDRLFELLLEAYVIMYLYYTYVKSVCTHVPRPPNYLLHYTVGPINWASAHVIPHITLWVSIAFLLFLFQLTRILACVALRHQPCFTLCTQPCTLYFHSKHAHL